MGTQRSSVEQDTCVLAHGTEMLDNAGQVLKVEYFFHSVASVLLSILLVF